MRVSDENKQGAHPMTKPTLAEAIEITNNAMNGLVPMAFAKEAWAVVKEAAERWDRGERRHIPVLDVDEFYRFDIDAALKSAGCLDMETGRLFIEMYTIGGKMCEESAVEKLVKEKSFMFKKPTPPQPTGDTT